MTFKEKIDKILKTNTLEINSPYGLEQYIGASPGAINKYYRKNAEPGRGTIRKILEELSINPEWWDTGKGEIYLVNGTHGDKRTAIESKMNALQDELILLLRQKVSDLEAELAECKSRSKK